VKGAVVMAAGALVAVPAAAQDHDLQQWTLLAAQGKVAGDLIVYAEVQPRVTDELGRLGQVLVRPAIGVQLRDGVTLLAGYAYVRTEPLGGTATDEHRAWQQLVWPIARAGALTVTARTRIEQRTVEGRRDLGWRFRQQVRAQAPVRPGAKLTAIAWTEPFYAFDSTDWGQRRGFDQWRTFVGMGVPVTKGLTAEPGYQNQTVFRRGADRVNHIASVNLFYRF
jgi:hypothetical protein